MKKAILATKVGMTQIFNEDGMLIPVTVLQAGPCVVTQVKTDENDGYTAVQVGFGDIREKLVNKPETGHFAKAGVAVKRFVKEFRFENAAEYEVGQEIKADIFAAGDHIDATAVSKGKGFQGAIKRHSGDAWHHLLSPDYPTCILSRHSPACAQCDDGEGPSDPASARNQRRPESQVPGSGPEGSYTFLI